jgi:hypothetical protein
VIKGVEDPISAQKTILDLHFTLKMAEPPDEHLGSDAFEEFVNPETPATVFESLKSGPRRRKCLELPRERERLG